MMPQRMPIGALRLLRAGSKAPRPDRLRSGQALAAQKTLARDDNPLLPAKSDLDGTEIRRGVIAGSVHKAVLCVDFDAARHFAGDSCAEVVAVLVHAGVDKIAAERNARVLAPAPPGPETIAGRAWNGNVAV